MEGWVKGSIQVETLRRWGLWGLSTWASTCWRGKAERTQVLLKGAGGWVGGLGGGGRGGLNGLLYVLGGGGRRENEAV